MRGVAGAKVHLRKEAGQEGAPRHRLSQNPQGGVRTGQLQDGTRPRSLPRRIASSGAKRTRGRMRFAT